MVGRRTGSARPTQARRTSTGRVWTPSSPTRRPRSEASTPLDRDATRPGRRPGGWWLSDEVPLGLLSFTTVLSSGIGVGGDELSAVHAASGGRREDSRWPAAKPIIDIQVSVPDVEHEPSYLEPLVAARYRLRVREPGHRMFRRSWMSTSTSATPGVTGSDATSSSGTGSMSPPSTGRPTPHSRPISSSRAGRP